MDVHSRPVNTGKKGSGWGLEFLASSQREEILHEQAVGAGWGIRSLAPALSMKLRILHMRPIESILTPTSFKTFCMNYIWYLMRYFLKTLQPQQYGVPFVPN